MALRNRTRWWATGALIVALLVPAGLAAGSHGDDTVSAGDASVILLTMGSRDEITWQSLKQTITTKNNDCLVVQFGGDQILTMTAGGGSLGQVKAGFGVLSPSDGAGEPCGRVTPGESISVALGAAAEGHLMSAVDIDLELKFNATVSVSYRHEGVQVASDIFSPGTSSDDGPDSKDGDNYRYFHRPTNGSGDPVYFDEVVFSASSGSFSLEGGADLSNNQAANAFGQLDPTSKSSQFEVVPAFDGVITCRDELVIEGGNISGSLKMHSMDFGEGWSTDGCPLKPYFSFATDDTIGFIPVLEGTQARYTILVTATEQAVTQLGGQILSLDAVYDPEGDPNPTQPLLGCLGQPVTDSEAGGYEAFWTQEDTGMLPGGETACYYSVQLLTTGDGVGTEIWGIYFEDDPSFGFK